MAFNSEYLPRADVVFSVMFLNKKLCQTALTAILGEEVELVDIITEAKNDLHKATLNSIYFDIKTRTTDGRIITLDIQRRYSKNRIRNRTVYYACREITSQKVENYKYEKLKSVVVSFILTEAGMEHTMGNAKIVLKNTKTNEEYSELLTIHEVNIKKISALQGENMWILRNFFEITNEYDYHSFIRYYGSTELGNLLVENYNFAVNNISLLDTLSKEEKFMYKLSEEERLIERQEGRQEAMQEGIYSLITTLKELECTKSFIISKVCEKFSLTQEQAIQLFNNCK